MRFGGAARLQATITIYYYCNVIDAFVKRQAI